MSGDLPPNPRHHHLLPRLLLGWLRNPVGSQPAPQGHQLGGNRRSKGISPSWAVPRTIHAARPDGDPIYVILDNLSAQKNWRIRRWARKNKVELCFTPTNAPWATPIEAYFGPCGSSPPTTPTTPTTPAGQGNRTSTYAGATPTHGTPVPRPLSAVNVPASAVSASSAGAATHVPKGR